MMTNDLMLGGVYILMAMMLVLGSLMARREPAAKLVTMALAWIVIFAAGFVLFTFRDDFGYVAAAPQGGGDRHAGDRGQETRIPMAIDGHFWVHAKLNGHDVKFLVDSGATMTTIDRETAERCRRDGFAASATNCPHRQRHHPRRAAAAPTSSASAASLAAMSGCRSPTTTISTSSG